MLARTAARNRSDDTQFFFQKVLLSLFAATIVAVSEVGLYIIWDTRHERRKLSTSSKGRSSSVRAVEAIDEDASLKSTHQSAALTQMASSVDPHQNIDKQALRQRAGIKLNSSLG